MSPRIWDVSEDGLIEYLSVTQENLEGGLNVMRRSFFVDEKVCIGVELSRDPEAASELEELCIRAARDGVSLVAVEKSSGKVVAVAFNKMQVKTGRDEQSYFTQYAANCKYPSSKALVQFMNDADSMVDLFKVCKANCLLEVMFLATLPEFRSKGIARKLMELTIKFGKTLKSGENVKTAINDEPLPLEPVPAVVSAIFTSIITQTLGKKLGFEKAAEISYEKFTFEGKSFASRIGPDTPTTTVEYKVL